MDRYEYTPKKLGKFETSRLIKLPIDVEDQYIITREGDRFDILAHQFYDDMTLWWVIATANDLRADSMTIAPGIQLRIPKNLRNLSKGLKEQNRDK